MRPASISAPMYLLYQFPRLMACIMPKLRQLGMPVRIAISFPHSFKIFRLRVGDSCFDPAEALHRCVASPNVDQNTLLFRLGSTSNPLHRSVHAELMRRVLESPINLHHNRYLANMLRGHTRHDVLALLKSTISPDEDNAIWLVREVESARGERLIDEAGHFRL
jgi:hypothetical protein